MVEASSSGAMVPAIDIVERDRLEHVRDHDREREVANDTAKRLEREVEQTAVRLGKEVEQTAVRLGAQVKETADRLERTAEVTALRIEKAVETALEAVNQTASVHAEAHQREHVSHERIHTVEKGILDKAEVTERENARVLRQSLEEYKHTANEWRAQLREQENKFLRKDEADTIFNTMAKDIRQNTDAVIALRETVVTTFSAQSGKSSGMSDLAKGVSIGLGSLLTILTIIGLIVAFTR